MSRKRHPLTSYLTHDDLSDVSAYGTELVLV